MLRSLPTAPSSFLISFFLGSVERFLPAKAPPSSCLQLGCLLWCPFNQTKTRSNTLSVLCCVSHSHPQLIFRYVNKLMLSAASFLPLYKPTIDHIRTGRAGRPGSGAHPVESFSLFRMKERLISRHYELPNCRYCTFRLAKYVRFTSSSSHRTTGCCFTIK